MNQGKYPPSLSERNFTLFHRLLRKGKGEFFVVLMGSVIHCN